MLANKIMGATSAAPDLNYIEDVFSTYLYTGNGSTQTITNGVDLAGEGGLVWFKPRNTANNHNLIDSARGLNKFLISNDTAANGTTGAGYGVASFNSDGFSLNPPWTSSTNTTDTTQVAWTFRKQPKFFDIVTWTGDGVAGRTVAHSLGSAPGAVIIKSTSLDVDWLVFHRSAPGTVGNLNTTSLFTDAGFTMSMTSTTFNVSSGTGNNASGETYVAYLFAHNAGGFGLSGTENVVSCGSYTGNGTSAGLDVDLGYEAQFVIAKRATVSDASGNWVIADTMRNMNQQAVAEGARVLLANTTADESPQGYLATNSKGFHVNSDSTTINQSGQTYIYIAIRRGPMKVPTDGTKVYNAIARTGTGGATNITGVGFSPDLVHTQTRDSYGANGMFDRLRGPPKQLRPASSVAEQTTTDITAYLMDGVATGGSVAYINDSGIPYINHFFRRAPSFFDEVCYTGTGAARTVAHNLTVAPELIIVKNRASYYWVVWQNSLPPDTSLYLAGTNGASPDGTAWTGVSPTATTFGVSTDSANNGSGNNYVAYLFATCAGVSKVGSYTGTGTTQSIACGFTAGARFVMIKRTDSTGDWYVWDSARGIVAGNDPHLSLNSTAAEVTADDSIDVDSAGFIVNQDAATNINVSGGSYIFLSVA